MPTQSSTPLAGGEKILKIRRTWRSFAGLDRMADRYFVTQPISGDRATLIESEAHHLAHVMRAKPGTEVVLFDGSGAEFMASVVKVSRNSIELSVGTRVEIDREPRRRLTLGVALPKGDRQRWLVEKATELGVARLVPLETNRGVAQPTDNALARLERSVIEAAKQCGRNRLMHIAAPTAWAEFVSQAPDQARRLVAHPAVRLAPASADAPLLVDQLSTENNAHREIWLAIGPEGGLTDEEVAVGLAHGWRTIDLGASILRVETAALALASVCLLGTNY